MRGARLVLPASGAQPGIIPAYAGSTIFITISRSPPTDHPRVCGEHSLQSILVMSPKGSSPRMRGAHIIVRIVPSDTGIIPAYAGSTWNSVLRTSVSKDHPRVCGEHDGNISGDTVMPGSSPRMRGALGLAHGVPVFQGIIPAYAGSTIGYQRIRSIAWDHPRVCGEHYQARHLVLEKQGSSPRMRGARVGQHDGRLQPGIIPAYAGSTPLQTTRA